jgi:hypothetical protein
MGESCVNNTSMCASPTRSVNESTSASVICSVDQNDRPSLRNCRSMEIAPEIPVSIAGDQQSRRCGSGAGNGRATSLPRRRNKTSGHPNSVPRPPGLGNRISSQAEWKPRYVALDEDLILEIVTTE